MKVKHSVYLIAYVFVMTCGRPYIRPEPDFSWPEMAASKIAGTVGVYLPEEKLEFTFEPPAAAECCRHKRVELGPGVHRAVDQSCEAVFSRAVALGGAPSDTYIKSLNLRGLLHLKDLSAGVEFVPLIENSDGTADSRRYTIFVSLNLNFSAIDFLLSDIREFNIEARVESQRPEKQDSVNKGLERTTEAALEEMAERLARELVTIYGARP